MPQEISQRHHHPAGEFNFVNHHSISISPCSPSELGERCDESELRFLLNAVGWFGFVALWVGRALCPTRLAKRGKNVGGVNPDLHPELAAELGCVS